MRLFNRFTTFFIVVFLASLLGCASTAKQEGTGEYVDDTVLEVDPIVKTEFSRI